MQRKASAVWRGGLKDGKGTLSTDSGVLKQTPYSFSTRFENQPGTNPEKRTTTGSRDRTFPSLIRPEGSQQGTRPVHFQVPSVHVVDNRVTFRFRAWARS